MLAINSTAFLSLTPFLSSFLLNACSVPYREARLERRAFHSDLTTWIGDRTLETRSWNVAARTLAKPLRWENPRHITDGRFPATTFKKSDPEAKRMEYGMARAGVQPTGDWLVVLHDHSSTLLILVLSRCNTLRYYYFLYSKPSAYSCLPPF